MEIADSLRGLLLDAETFRVKTQVGDVVPIRTRRGTAIPYDELP